MEAMTATRQRPTHPMSYYVEMVKDMDDSQKLRLIAVLAESINPAKAADDEEYSLRPFTMAEINAMLDEAETNFAAGKGIPHEEMMREWDEEIERWEQEESEMAEKV